MLRWITNNFSKVAGNVANASQQGVDETLAAAVERAKSNHPGWRSLSGAAQASIRVGQADEQSNGISGQWGSYGVKYMLFLELKHGSALRNAADAEYPQLSERIKAHL